jgi:hypothetical protein
VDEVGQGKWRGHRCGEGLAHGKVVVGGAHQKGGWEDGGGDDNPGRGDSAPTTGRG